MDRIRRQRQVHLRLPPRVPVRRLADLRNLRLSVRLDRVRLGLVGGSGATPLRVLLRPMTTLLPTTNGTHQLLTSPFSPHTSLAQLSPILLTSSPDQRILPAETHSTCLVEVEEFPATLKHRSNRLNRHRMYPYLICSTQPHWPRPSNVYKHSGWRGDKKMELEEI